MKYTFELDFHGSKVMKRDESGQITTYVHDDEFVRVDFHEAALAAKDARIQELQKEAAANHKILQQALDGCDRVDAESAAKDAEIERLRAEIAEWIAPSKKRHPHTARLQPIESAPREPGKRILLHFASTGVTCTGLWRGDFGWALTQPDGSLYWCRESGVEPTHWMPLLDGSIDAHEEPK